MEPLSTVTMEVAVEVNTMVGVKVVVARATVDTSVTKR